MKKSKFNIVLIGTGLLGLASAFGGGGGGLGSILGGLFGK